MFNNILKITAALSVLTLAACGGAGTAPINNPPAPAPQPTPPDPQSFQRGPDTVTYDESTGTIRVGNATVGTSGDTLVVSNGQANVYHNSSSNYLTAIATNGDGYGVSAARRATGASALGIVYGNDRESDLPTTGNASFSGDYAAITVESPGRATQRVSSTLTGDAFIYADFDDNTVEGSIFNRRVFTSSGAPFSSTGAANISFGETTIGSDGRFTSSTQSGQFTQSGRTYSASGSLQGVFAGKDGDSVAGSVVLNHNSSGLPTYQERGVFVANEN